MSNQSSDMIGLLAVAIPIAGVFLYAAYDHQVRPLFIPKAEIERLARELIAKYPDNPEQAAFNEEYSAWRNSNGFDQGKWKRVRQIIKCLK
jgi:hypothetical protein